MVKIMAKHRFRNKTITMNISENTLAHAENGYTWAIRRIFRNLFKVMPLRKR